jgi:hypothetical protein
MPKSDRYDQVIAELAVEHPRATEVWRRFQQMAAERGWHDIPAERTVKRRVGDFQRLPKTERDERARVHWPATMRAGLMPWEASRAVLDLLRFRNDAALGRPSVAEARWYWWLTLASPRMPVEQGSILAAAFVAADFAQQLGPEQTAASEPYEWLLAYEPWASQISNRMYQRAQERERDPVPGLSGPQSW